jgi:dTMP kinase
MSNSSGTLIAFEGIDGSGKSTQWRRLGKWLEELGQDVVLSFEPTNRPHGQALRDAWATGVRLPVEEEMALFDADRKEHIDELIQPALDRGAIVLLDRYYYSSAVYQGTRSGQSPDAVLRHYEEFCPRADLMLLFDLFVDIALERMRSSRSNLDAMEQSENLKLVRHTYMRLNCPETRVVDASKSPDEVWERTKSVVQKFLSER